MKVWLNDLKPGDKFWLCGWEGPRKVTILGPDYDPTSKTAKWKLSNGASVFVNHHVFTTKEEAIDDFLPKLRQQLELLKAQKSRIEFEIGMCKQQIEDYERCLN